MRVPSPRGKLTVGRAIKLSDTCPIEQPPNANLFDSPKRPKKLKPIAPPAELCLIGASCRAAAESARKAFPTIRIIASDLFGDAQLRQVCDEVHTIAGEDFPSGFATLLKANHPQSRWIYCGGVENAPALVDQIAEQRILLGCDATALRTSRDPIQVATCLRDASLPFAPVKTTNASVGDPPSLSKPRWLCKPLLSCAGHGIQPCFADEINSRDLDTGTYLQQWIEGEMQSGCFVTDGTVTHWLGTTRGVTLHESDQTHPAAAANPFGYAGSTGPLTLSLAMQQQWQRIGETFASRFRLKGLFGVDAIATASGDIVSLEINPRYTASMELIELASQQSLVGLHLEACMPDNDQSLSSNFDPQLSNQLRTKQIVYARQPCSFVESTFRDYIAGWKAAYANVRFSDTPFFGSHGDSHHFDVGQPVMTIIHAGDSPLKEPAAL